MPHANKPVVEVTHIDDYQVNFILSNTDLSMANSLRRVFHAEVPTLGMYIQFFIINKIHY